MARDREGPNPACCSDGDQPVSLWLAVPEARVGVQSRRWGGGGSGLGVPAQAQRRLVPAEEGATASPGVLREAVQGQRFPGRGRRPPPAPSAVTLQRPTGRAGQPGPHW